MGTLHFIQMIAFLVLATGLPKSFERNACMPQIGTFHVKRINKDERTNDDHCHLEIILYFMPHFFASACSTIYKKSCQEESFLG